MRLRILALALILFVMPVAIEAQPVGKVARIGYLLLPPLANAPSAERQAFLQGLRELGYDEGRNVIIEYRSAAWNRELLPELVGELVERKVDVILAVGPQPSQAAREGTKTIPIVMVAAVDAVESGFVASLARPGANVTGFSGQLPGLAGKRLELLREAVPLVSRVVVIWNPGNPAANTEWKATQAAARTLGMKLESVEVRGAESFVAALPRILPRQPAAVVMINDTLTVAYREILAEFEQGKGAKDRYVPLAVRLLQQFRAHWAYERPGPWVFAAPTAQHPIHPTTAQRAYWTAKRLAGITKRGGIHALRHAYATHLLEAGQDLHTVQRPLGHRHVTTTMRYFHLSQGRVLNTPSPLDLPEPPAA